MRQIEFVQRQAMDEAVRLKEQLGELRGVAERLQDAQNALDLVANERDVLRDRTERLKDDLDDTRGERDRLSDHAAELDRAVETFGQQTQRLQQQVQLLDRLCALAFQQLIAVRNGLPLQLSPELQTALERFMGGQLYGGF